MSRRRLLAELRRLFDPRELARLERLAAQQRAALERLEAQRERAAQRLWDQRRGQQ